MSKARFITLEGGEGAGKSTQIRLLADFLRTKGIDVVITREPGGSDGAEAIRNLLISGDKGKWDALSEVLLFSAARRNHLINTIFPALQAGSWVISDRFADSTMAYQGYGYGEKGVNKDIISELYQMVAGDFVPDLTFMLDISPAEGFKRVASRNEEISRFEKMNMDFHLKMQQAFKDIAENNPERCVVLDASLPQQNIHNQIATIVSNRFLQADAQCLKTKK